MGSFACLMFPALTAFAQPVVSNVTASQTVGTRSVAIAYTLSHPQSLPCTEKLQALRDNEVTWESVTSATGALGAGIASTFGGAATSVPWITGNEWLAQIA